MKRAHFIARGRVQGVSFRWFVKDAALLSELTGTVRNLADGSVEVFVEGQEEKILILKQKMQNGNGLSRVDAIEEKWDDYRQEWKNFTILF